MQIFAKIRFSILTLLSLRITILRDQSLSIFSFLFSEYTLFLVQYFLIKLVLFDILYLIELHDNNEFSKC